MGADVKTIIAWTFGIIVLAWVLTNAAAVNTVTTSFATNYGTAVNALKPGGTSINVSGITG